MTHKVVSGTLASAVADTGTFTVSYPARVAPENANTTTDEGDHYLAMGHKLVLGQNDVLTYPQDFDITLGASNITVTNRTGSSWPADTDFTLELQEQGKRVYTDDQTTHTMARMTKAFGVLINLGAPDTADVDGIFEAQSGAAGALTLDGALVTDGIAYFDVPRNIVIDSGGADTATLTFTGTDEYGNTMTEDIQLNGTTAVQGDKAFKTITGVVSDATISNGAFAGPGNKLGLPVFLPSAGNIVKELEDGAAPTAGTVVAGVRTAGGATATSGDVRGTYTPNSTPDGAAVFQLLCMLPDPGFRGMPQA